MQFFYPTFLWALAALAIPVIIHLFYFRRFRKVYFSNVKFLREIKEETSMRSRLRNLLVLLSRLLAVACLVFAFAQPFLPASNQSVGRGQRAVSVYVDNSYSMQAENDRAPLLEVAKDRARDIIKAYGVEDRFQILSNEFAGRQQRLVGQEEALNLIDEMAPHPATRSLARIADRQLSTLARADAPNRTVYQLSDFQKSLALRDALAPAFGNDPSNITNEAAAEGAAAALRATYTDTAYSFKLLPLRAVRNQNVGIDSAWFDAPLPQLNQNNLLLVKIRNYSNEDLDNIRLSMRYQQENKPISTLSLAARSARVDSIYLNINQPGVGRVELQITDYPIQFDDTYFLTFNVAQQLRVLNVHAGSTDRNLTAALGGLSIFKADFSNSQQLDYSSLGDYQLIILSGLEQVSSGLAARLNEYVAEGGNLLVFPPTSAEVASYRAFLTAFPADPLGSYEAKEREVSFVNTKEFVFKDVFGNEAAALRLPTTQGNFPISTQSSNRQEALLRYRDGSTALAKYAVAQGHLYLSTAPLDIAQNTLALNAEIFIPMLYKMAISSGKNRPIAYTIGADEIIETPRRQATAELVYKLRSVEGEFIPGQRIVGNRTFLEVGNQVPKAGHYDLLLQAAEAVDAFAFNFDRRESQLDFLSDEELKELLGDRVQIVDATNEAAFASQLQSSEQGKPLWRYFIWAALLFLLVEVLLLRFWKA